MTLLSLHCSDPAHLACTSHHAPGSSPYTTKDVFDLPLPSPVPEDFYHIAIRTCINTLQSSTVYGNTMATNGRKAPRVDLTTEGKVYIYKADNHKLRFVFLLLMHQPSITYDGFDCGTGHSKEAMGGLITRMKKQFITDAKPGDIGAAAATGKKRGRSAKNAEVYIALFLCMISRPRANQCRMVESRLRRKDGRRL